MSLIRKNVQNLPVIKPMSGRELKVIEFLLALESRINESGDALRTRLGHIPNGWRDWRLMSSLCTKLLGEIYDTLPDKTLLYMDKMRVHGEALIRFSPAARTPEWLLVKDTDLKALINVAIASECAVCMKEGKAIERCKLRRAMYDMTPPHDETENDCGYREVAVNSDYGQYI